MYENPRVTKIHVNYCDVTQTRLNSCEGRRMTTAADFTADKMKRSAAFADFATEEKAQDGSSAVPSLNLARRTQHPPDAVPFHCIPRR